MGRVMSCASSVKQRSPRGQIHRAVPDRCVRLHSRTTGSNFLDKLQPFRSGLFSWDGVY